MIDFFRGFILVKNKECTHTTPIPGHWKMGSGDPEWIDKTEDQTVVDLDLHRYQCTQCKEIMYYSGRAKEQFEEGIDHGLVLTKI